MMIFRALLIAFFALCSANQLRASPEKKEIGGVIYQCLQVTPSAVRIIWKNQNGAQLQTFSAVVEYLRNRGEVPLTLMNGGIFEPGGVPSGLLVQDGKQLRPINNANGSGNFFLKPNGIFLICPGGAAVVRSDEYPLKDMKIQYAVQSGPLLLRKGSIHPVFKAMSTSRLHRNGVGVTPRGDVVFLITDEDSPKRPNLFEFAEAFSRLGCIDALFLDGDVSQMKTGEEIPTSLSHFGSIIAVVDSPKLKAQ